MNPDTTAVAAPKPSRRYWPYVLGAVLLLTAGVWGGIGKRLAGDHPDTARYTARAQGRPLTAGFLSYEGIDAVSKQLAEREYEPTRRTLATPRDREYPVHVMDTLQVADYSMLGGKGRLTLEFFNDRLYEIGFEPDDPKACSKALDRSEARLKRDRNGRAEYTDGELRVASNVDLSISEIGRSLGTKPYVLWQELRLIRQRDEWDRDFGSLPVRAQ